VGVERVKDNRGDRNEFEYNDRERVMVFIMIRLVRNHIRMRVQLGGKGDQAGDRPGDMVVTCESGAFPTQRPNKGRNIKISDPLSNSKMKSISF
jgi:hypothetical protein